MYLYYFSQQLFYYTKLYLFLFDRLFLSDYLFIHSANPGISIPSQKSRKNAIRITLDETTFLMNISAQPFPTPKSRRDAM